MKIPLGTQNQPHYTGNKPTEEEQLCEKRGLEPPTQCIDQDDEDETDSRNRLGILPRSEEVAKCNGLLMEREVCAP